MPEQARETNIRHLYISRSAAYLSPQILHNLFCFSFLLGITAVPREIENNAYANFWGHIRCIMGDVQVAYWGKEKEAIPFFRTI